MSKEDRIDELMLKLRYYIIGVVRIVNTDEDVSEQMFDNMINREAELEEELKKLLREILEGS
jgi:hypothetical protein